MKRSRSRRMLSHREQCKLQGQLIYAFSRSFYFISLPTTPTGEPLQVRTEEQCRPVVDTVCEVVEREDCKVTFENECFPAPGGATADTGRQEEQAKEQRCTERLERRCSVVEDEVCEDRTEVSLCFT